MVIFLFKTPLQMATFYGHIECVRSLLDAGADATEKDVRYERDGGEKV